jgi:hypothetical protein
MKEYYKLGLCELTENGYVFTGEYSNNGYIFKDEEAFEKNWDAPCYVPEGEIELVDRCEFYTHNDLLKLCYNNHRLCNSVFNELDWQYPETLLEDIDMHSDFRWYFDFVKVGAKVKWNDVTGETSGEYYVLKLPEKSDLINDMWGSDTVILIGDGSSEIEVNLCELEAVEFSEIELYDMLRDMFYHVSVNFEGNEDEFYTVAHDMLMENVQRMESDYPFLKDSDNDGELWYDNIRECMIVQYMYGLKISNSHEQRNN